MIRRKSQPPMTDADEAASRLTHSKPKFRVVADEPIDTRLLPLRKIHPDRNDAYKRWLRYQPCAIAGLADAETGRVHVCWSPDMVSTGQYASDPMHSGKAYSGRLKRDDSGCMPGCRVAHDAQENDMDRFDRKFGVDRHEIATEHFARFTAEQERRK